MGEQIDVVSLYTNNYNIIGNQLKSAFTSPSERALISASTILVFMGGIWGGVCSTHCTALAMVSLVVFTSSAFQHSTPAVHLNNKNKKKKKF